ncbi:MAG: CehA/McbA family metallohydrolase [Acidobacteria bacterium]|nr:CehA/McbA family metallohydrolase [Acidobacteriota bacterium]
MRRILVAAVLTSLAGGWYLALPPRADPPPAGAGAAAGSVRGAIHIHTSRSDGTGTVDEVAAAAARAGLHFIILTDHGDATREPDPPQYRAGVLCIDAVEISTADGHVLALGLPQAPYPLGGEGRDVVEDIARLGGFAIAGHPGSIKPELQWSDWRVPVGGLEWMNGDSEWRDESRWTLLKALLTYPARPAETLASLLDRPDAVLQQWDQLTGERRVVAVAGADAHARLGFRSFGEPYDNGSSLHVPSYEEVFRLFSNVLPGVVLSGEAAADAGLILSALREGHVYSVVDAIGRGGNLTFTLEGAGRPVEGGDAVQGQRPILLRADVAGPAGARIRLLKDGSLAAEGSPPRLEQMADGAAPAVYRVEVTLPGAPGAPPVPWMVSNPIYVGQRQPPAPVAQRAASRFGVRYAGGPATDWAMETSPASKAAFDVTAAPRGTELALRYALGGAASSSPFAAFVLRAGPALAQYDRLIFTARAERPMRLSVQLREPAGLDGRRWRRSVFVGTEPREITVAFDDLRPIDPAAGSPTLGNVDSLLFVVDTMNTPLGGSGRIWIDDVKYGR